MKTYLILMRSTSTFLGELNMYLLEVETITQAVNYLVSLYSTDTIIKVLLQTMIEYYQI